MTETARKSRARPPRQGKYTPDQAFARAELYGVGVRVHPDGSASLTYDPDDAPQQPEADDE